MSSYEDIIKENDNKNWLKGSLALTITKEGLRNLVDGDSNRLHQRIHSSVLQANNLSPGTTCCQCLTENLFQCPTKGLCSHPRNCKFHDTQAKVYRPCPLQICDDFRDEICRLHRFKRPSWKNSNADRWCVNHWEIAKCFMPPDGYKDVSSFAETDFNGIISILINCTAFQQTQNILTQARNIGRAIRHSSDLKVTDADLKSYFTTLTTLLSDPADLSVDPKAQEAILKLNKLQVDKLYISNEDLHEILHEARIVVEIGKRQIEQAIAEGNNTLEKAVAEGKSTLETWKRQIGHSMTEGERAIETGKKEIDDKVTEGKGVLETGKLQIENSVAEGVKRLNVQADDAILKVSKEIDTDVRVPVKTQLEENAHAGIQAINEAAVAVFEKVWAYKMEEDLQYRLAKDYKKSLSSVPISPMVSDKDELLDMFYVTPKILEKNHKIVGASQQQKGALVSSYRNIFWKKTKKKKQNKTNNIYVIGEAGMGKTTFSTKCALDWGTQIFQILKFETNALKKAIGNEFQDVEVLAEFDFLFLVNLRNARKVCNLTDMITNQLINRIYHADELTEGKSIMLRVLSTRNCLILADGLDEWSHPRESNCSCTDEERVVPFLSPTIDATVVMTSRPWRMAHHRVRDSRIDKYLEIEGVAESKRLAQNIIGCLNGKTESDEESKEFMSFIEKRDLSNLLSVPILVSMLVCLWIEGVGESFSLCEIYALMLDMLFGRKTITTHSHQEEKTELPSCFQNAKNIFKNIPALLSRAKLAFEQLFSLDQKYALVFKKVRFLSHKDLDIVLQTGILRENKMQSLIMNSSSFSFIHKIVQEFLAALHLSLNPGKVGRLVDLAKNQSDMSQVFIYICGLNSKIANQMSAMLCSNSHICTDDHPKNKDVLYLQGLIAAGHIEACANDVADINLSLYFFSFGYNTKNISTIKNLLSSNKSQVRYLRAIESEEISEEDIQEVVRLSAETLTAVELGKSERYDLTACPKLKFLRIYGRRISDIVLNAKCLVTCVINYHQPALEKAMFHALTSNINVSSLKHIDLFYIKNVDLFCHTLPKLSQLENAYIAYTNLGDHLIHLPRSVSRVELTYVTMSVEVFRGLVDCLEDSTHTVTCCLCQCTVTGIECKWMKLYVRSCQKFVVLEDRDNIFYFKTNHEQAYSKCYY